MDNSEQINEIEGSLQNKVDMVKYLRSTNPNQLDDEIGPSTREERRQIMKNIRNDAKGLMRERDNLKTEPIRQRHRQAINKRKGDYGKEMISSSTSDPKCCSIL